MYVYYFLFSLSLINILFNKRTFSYFVFFVLLVVSISRFDIGYDWLNYKDIYLYHPKTYFNDEILFYALVNFSNYIGLSYREFVIVCSSLTMLFFFISFTKIFKDDKFVIVVSYFIVSFVFFEHFNIIRQGLAISIFSFSLYYVINRDIYKYVFCVLVASLIHTSAIILLPFYFILNKELFSNKYIYAAIIVSVMFLIRIDINELLIKVISVFSYFDFINRYISGGNVVSAFADSKSDLGLSKLYPAIVFVLCCLFSKVDTSKRRDLIFFNAFFISILLLLLSYRVDIIFRFYSYFEVSMIYSFSMLFSGFNRKSRIILHFVNIIIYIVITNNYITILDMYPYRIS